VLALRLAMQAQPAQLRPALVAAAISNALSKNFVVHRRLRRVAKLVHELETYQRVVHIDEINFHLPPRTDGKAKLQFKITPVKGRNWAIRAFYYYNDSY